MDRDLAIETLKRHRAELERRGVRHAALFGSIARGEQGPKSDLDILVDLGSDTTLGIYDYVSLQRFIGSLFGRKVDVVSRGGLKPRVRANALRDAIYAF